MNEREIRYQLTGDASKLKSELAAVQRQAEEAGKKMDRALTKAFKESTLQATEQFGRNMDLIKRAMPKGTEFNNIEKGFNNAFNTKNLAKYAKEQSNIATSLQRMDGQYRSLQANADSYARTLQKTGVDSATVASITNTWLENQRQAIRDNARAYGAALGEQFGGLGRLAPAIAAGIKVVDEQQSTVGSAITRIQDLSKELGSTFGRVVRGQISDASKGVLKFGESVTKATNSVARLGFGIAAALAAFATIPILKTITSIESAQLGLESLLGTAEEAGLAIYRIYEFANQTAYDTSSLIAYEQRLVSVGLSADQAFGIISRVSDIGGAFGTDAAQLERFYYVLTQIFGAGRAVGNDFLQIQNAVPGFIQAIGETMGISQGAVKQAVSDGLVTSQVVADTLENLTSEGGRAFQGAIRQSSTLSGMMNNLFDNLKRVGMAFFGVRIEVDGMQPSIDGIYSRIKALVSTILEFVENPLAVRGFEVLGDVMGKALAVLTEYPQIIAILTGLFLAFATDLITRIPFIGNLIGEISYGTGFLLGLFIALAASSEAVRHALVTVLAQLVAFFEVNKSLFVEILANFQTLLATIGEGVAPALILATQVFLNFATVMLHVTNYIILLANTIARALGPEITKLITITFSFVTIALMLTPIILKVAAAFVTLAAALSSPAFKLALLITLLVVLIGYLTGLFGKMPSKPPLEDLSGIFDDISNTTIDATAGIDSAADAMTGAGEAAKKAAKQLAGFDKMNVIYSSDSGDSDANPGAITGLTPPEIKTPDLESLKNKFKDLFKDIESSLPEVHWWDLIVPAAVTASILGLISLLKKVDFSLLPTRAALAMLKLKEVFTNGLSKIPAVFQRAVTRMGNMFSRLAPMVTANLPRILASFGTIVTRLVGLIPGWGWALAAALTAIILVIFNWESISGWFSDIFDNIISWFEGVGETIGRVFTDALDGSFGVIPQIFASIVVLVVAVIATIIEAVAKLPTFIWEKVIVPIGAFFDDLFVGIHLALILAWTLIKEVFSRVAGWVNEKVIIPVRDYFSKLWDDIVKTATTFWNKLVILFSPIFGWIKEKVVDPIAKRFNEAWTSITDTASFIFGKIKTALSPVFTWINNNIVKPVQNAFEVMSRNIKNAFDAIKGGIQTAFEGVAGVVKGVFNGVIDSINRAIDAINRIKVPKEVPHMGGMSPNFPRIPRLARGGVVDDPTLAIIGEAGREAVMPLENNTGWIDELAGKLNSQGSNEPTVINVYLDGNKVGGAVSNSINNRSMVTGVNQIYV